MAEAKIPADIAKMSFEDALDELQDLDHMPEELKERERELRAQGFVNG